MRVGACLAVLTATVLTGCGPGFNARVVLPPDGKIRVGQIYQSSDYRGSISRGPVGLRNLCYVPQNIANTLLYEPDGKFDELTLSTNWSLSGNVSGIQYELATLGLGGKFSDYYEIKLTNGFKRSTPRDQADLFFNRLMSIRSCYNAYSEIKISAVYQIQAIYVGDVKLSTKAGFGISPEVALKLKALEPKIKAELERSRTFSFSAKQVVAVVEPLAR